MSTFQEAACEISAATATASPKGPDRSQDRVLSFAIEGSQPGVGVALCDGVGSYSDSGDVAEMVTAIVQDHVREMGILEGIISSAAAAATRVELGDVEGATTLIAIGANNRGELGYSFVGNGSLLEIQMDRTAVTKQLRAAELVLPHVSIAHGRPVLTSFIPMSPDEQLEVAAATLNANPFRERLLLACSDGVATHEERKIGVVAENESKWLEIPRPLAVVFDELVTHWDTLLNAADVGVYLSGLLQETLDSLSEDGVLDDDASIAAILVKPTAREPQ